MRRVIPFFLLIFLVATSVIALKVTTTINPYYMIVRDIVGDRAEVSLLIGPGQNPHVFSPTISDVKRLNEADLVVANGLELEVFLENTLEELTRKGKRVLLAGESVPPSLLSDEEDGNGEAATLHSHSINPHVWLDPTNVIHWLDGITAVLENLDPDGAAEYRERSFSYARALRDLDAWIAEQTSRIPPERRRLVTDHDSFGYFARRYGFHLIGTVLPGLSAVAEPSARDLAALEDAVRKLGVPAIFVGTTTNPALATQVAADTGTRLVVLYTGSLSAANGPAPTYVDLLRYNVTQIVAALTES